MRGSVMGEAGRTGRVQRLLNRETRELIVFRSSSTTVGESVYQAWTWAVNAVLLLMCISIIDFS